MQGFLFDRGETHQAIFAECAARGALLLGKARRSGLRDRLFQQVALLHPPHEVRQRKLQPVRKAQQDAQCGLLATYFHQGDVGTIQLTAPRQIFLRKAQLPPTKLDLGRECIDEKLILAGAHLPQMFQFGTL